MGYNDELDVVGALAALEMVLAELGHEFEPGAGVTAAQRVLLGAGPRAPADLADADASPMRHASHRPGPTDSIRY